MNHKDNEHAMWMALALQQAQLAAAAGEVPVGAVVVCDGQAIAQAYNQTLHLADPSAHAEVLALRMAAQKLGNHRLSQCTLYVSLEPCAMCSGAVFQARLQAVVYGAQEPKTGAAGSVVDLFSNRQLNHHTTVIGGVLAQPSRQLLADFFAQRRAATAQAHAQSMQRLSDAALRTPARAFAAGAAEGRYCNSLATAEGMRMHFLEQVPAQPLDSDAVVWVLLHPLWHWSAWWQPLMQELASQGQSVIAPDLIGWGRSDKPKRADWHTVERHVQLLLELLAWCEHTRCVLVCQDGSQWLVQALLCHLQATPRRGAAPLQVAAVVQLLCQETQPLWPAPHGAAAQKSWRLESYLRSHLPAQASTASQTAWLAMVAEAATPYPDAGHARNWASQCLRAASTEAPSLGVAAEHYAQLEAHAQVDAKQLAQQLRIMSQSWRH